MLVAASDQLHMQIAFYGSLKHMKESVIFLAACLYVFHYKVRR